MLQRTLIILKPDAVKRGFVGKIISRFEEKGLKIVAMKMVQLDKKLWKSIMKSIRASLFLKAW